MATAQEWTLRLRYLVGWLWSKPWACCSLQHSRWQSRRCSQQKCQSTARGHNRGLQRWCYRNWEFNTHVSLENQVVDQYGQLQFRAEVIYREKCITFYWATTHTQLENHSGNWILNVILWEGPELFIDQHWTTLFTLRQLFNHFEILFLQVGYSNNNGGYWTQNPYRRHWLRGTCCHGMMNGS